MPEWTPEDVELVAPIIRDAFQASPRVTAMRVLAALAEAGRLREPGGEEFGYRCDAGCEHTHMASEREARSLAAGRPGALVRRWVGPWQPVTETKENDHG